MPPLQGRLLGLRPLQKGLLQALLQFKCRVLAHKLPQLHKLPLLLAVWPLLWLSVLSACPASWRPAEAWHRHCWLRSTGLGATAPAIGVVAGCAPNSPLLEI
jgi:hypothetical protein